MQLRHAPAVDRVVVGSLLVTVAATAACSAVRRSVDYGNGYTIRFDRDRSQLFGEGYRSVLLFHGGYVTDQSFERSPTTRYVFYTAYGNWYLFDSKTASTRFLRKAPFDCTVKFYEGSQPPMVRCFDVFNDRVVEMRLD